MPLALGLRELQRETASASSLREIANVVRVAEFRFRSLHCLNGGAGGDEVDLISVDGLGQSAI
jgi:hypothetical protein